MVCLQATHKLILRLGDDDQAIPGTAFGALRGHSLAFRMGKPYTKEALCWGTILCTRCGTVLHTGAPRAERHRAGGGSCLQNGSVQEE